MRNIFLGGFLMAVCGCAYVSSTTTRTPMFGTNGVVSIQEQTTLTSYSLFDAGNTIAKVGNRSSTVTNSTGSYGPGTYIAGLDQSSTSSNAVALLQIIAALAAKGSLP